MSDWTLVPSLVNLRTEFNLLSPNRDKGADGSIGDSAHTSSSDHTPDEDSDVLRDHDADNKNEVHALDIDSSGPWPPSRTFHEIIMDVIEGEKAKWLDADDKCRLKYVIHNGKIYSTSTDFAPVTYTGSDPHTNHAHFSSRYETVCENDPRPWGVYDEENTVSKQEVIDAFKTDGIFAGPTNAASVVDGTNETWTLHGFLKDNGERVREVKAQTNQIPALVAAVAAMSAKVDTLVTTTTTLRTQLATLQAQQK